METDPGGLSHLPEGVTEGELLVSRVNKAANAIMNRWDGFLLLTYFCPPFQHLLSERLSSLGIMGEPRVPPLNPSETIVLSEHYRL